MKTRVICRGGETAVVIPEEIAAARRLGDADEVDVEVSDGIIVIRTEREVAVQANGKHVVIEPNDEDNLTLDEMLDRITDENKHELLDWGPPVGKELW